MVVPTYNERGNVEVLVARLRAALDGVTWRAIFVDDDSPDGTADAVKRMAAADDRIQCLRRVGRRGLAGAVLEGILASASPFVAVIDGDLQHDETRLPIMLSALRSGADMAVGTRFASADGLAAGLSPIRRMGSRAATWAARRVLRTELSDPVSGFFAARREIVEEVAPRLSHQGFKILFDIVASRSTPPVIVEAAYDFAPRLSGESKLDSRVVIDYAGLLLAKWTRGTVPAYIVIAALVTGAGVAGHLAVLAILIRLGQTFLVAQIAATIAVTAAALAIDAVMTWGRGALRRLVRGALGFLVGGLANVAVAALAHRHGAIWWAAGLAGALVGAIWSYATRER